jgi:hypothetical protein
MRVFLGRFGGTLAPMCVAEGLGMIAMRAARRMGDE